MLCPNCGSQAADGAKFCASCGSPLAAPAPQTEPAPQTNVAPQPIYKPDPEAYRQQPYQQQAPQQPYQQAYQQQDWQPSAAVPLEAPKKRSAKKGILAGIGVLLLVALIGGGIWFFSRGGIRSNKVVRAALNSYESLQAYTKDLPNLNQILENVQDLRLSGKKHVELESSYDYSYDWGDGDSFSFKSGYNVRVDSDLDARSALIEGTYASDGREIPFQAYVDKDQIQASSSLLLEEGEVLALPLKDLVKQWNASDLSRLTRIKLPEDLDLEKLQNLDVEKALEEVYGEDWTKFRDSLDTVEYAGSSPFERTGTIYTLTWDQEALNRMDAKTPDLDDLLDLDIDGPEDLAKIDFDDIGAEAVIAVLAEASKSVDKLLFHVVDNRLMGIYGKIEIDGDLTEITVQLLGEKNPWEYLTITVREGGRDTIAEIRLSTDNGQLRIEITGRSERSNGSFRDEGSYVILYNDADGRIRFEEDGEPDEYAPNYYLVPVDGGLRFSLKSEYSSNYYSSYTEIAYAVSSKTAKIAPLSGNPTNILELSDQELQDLGERIEDKLYQND